MRYSMQIASDPISSLALSVLGLTVDTAFVDLTNDSLIIKMGGLFKETLPLSNLGRGERIPWEWYMGLGLRTDFQGTVAPVSSFEKVIAIPLLREQTMFLPILGPLGLQVTCKRIVFSLKDPDTFLANFNEGRTDPGSGPTVVSIE